MSNKFATVIWGLALLGLLAARPAAADALVMIRLKDSFPEAMTALQQAIAKQGYTISRVQRVDVGLTRSGYKTAEYRVVFFGKPKQIAELPKKYPKLVPYLPLKITIFAERNETLVLAMNPTTLSNFYHKPALDKYLVQWEKDLHAIFDRVREGE